MMIYSERRRVLIAAGSGADQKLHALFSQDPLARWETLQADSFSRARFLLQHNPCELLLVNDDLYEREGGQGLAWLSFQRETPVVFLAGDKPQHLQKAYELGAHVCLSRQMALDHPPLLASAMDQAIQFADMRVNYRKTKEHLAESRQHVDRLVNMIWRATARNADMQWFSQRSMLERLSEELARAERHRIPLTLAIGEACPAPEDKGEKGSLSEWVMDRIAKGKRRCDVAGQYGLEGFMILMVHTPLEGGIECCRRLQRILEHPAEDLRGPHETLNAYFGISSTASGTMSAVSLLRCAEENLEAARRDSNDRLVVAESKSEPDVSETELARSQRQFALLD